MKEFSNKVSKSLRLDEILGAMTEVIQKGITTERVYVYLVNEDQEYEMTESTRLRTTKNFRLSSRHPVVEYLKHSEECLMMRDFIHMNGFRRMQEEEK